MKELSKMIHRCGKWGMEVKEKVIAAGILTTENRMKTSNYPCDLLEIGCHKRARSKIVSVE